MDLTPGQNFTQEDVELNFLWYTHTTLTGFKGHDRFVFYLTDVDNPSPPGSFFISIHTPQKGERTAGRLQRTVNLPTAYCQTVDYLLSNIRLSITELSITVPWNQILTGELLRADHAWRWRP